MQKYETENVKWKIANNSVSKNNRGLGIKQKYPNKGN